MIDRFTKQLFTLRQTFVLTLVFLRAFAHELLYLSAIPFMAYSFFSIYSGDGRMETILAIPDSMRFVIITLYFSILLILSPLVMRMVECLLVDTPFKLASQENLLLVRRNFLPLTQGIILIALAVSMLGFAAGILLPFFSALPMGSFLLMVLIFTVGIKLYIDYIFWSQFVVLKNQGTIRSFRSSHALVKKFYGKVVLNLFVLTLAAMLCIELLSFMLEALLTNTLVVNLTLSFFQSLFLVFIQLFTAIMFFNLTLYSAQED